MSDGLPYLLGHYSLIDHLGGGTFGTVFKAREQGSETDHALKVLRPGISNIRPEEVDKFRSEAKRHDALDNHVNIARFESLLTISCRQVSSTVLSLIDLSLPQSIAQRSTVDEPLMEVNGLRCVKAVPHRVGKCTEGEFFLDEESSLVVVRMKYYPDGDLRKLLKQPISHVHALKIGLGIVRGLTHMHHNDLVHRDLKPSNILMDSNSATEDSPKITDFGIARSMSLGDTTYAAGTNGWAAPEQFTIDHSGKIPPTLDVYAVGQVLFKMLTGVAPFSVEGLRRPGLIRGLDSSITEPIAEIVDRCRETDPWARYQTMAEVLEVLETAMNSDSRSRPTGALRGLPKLEQAYDDASKVIGGVLTSSLADRIRQFVLENHIRPAMEQGLGRVDVRASDVAVGMELRNRMPSVCNAMTGKKMEELAGVQIGSIRGPNPGANCVVDYLISDATSSPEHSHLSDSQGSDTPDEVPDADRFYNDGLHHLNRDSYQAAISAFGMAIKDDQNHSDAYTNRGVAYLQSGNYQAAYEDFTRAISIRDDDAIPFFNRGLACVEMGDNDGALSDYGEAIKLDPDDADFVYARGRLYVDLKDWDHALNDFYEALDLEPGHDGALEMIELADGSSDQEEDDDEDENVNVWEGVATIEGCHYSAHSEVARYRFVYANRRFDLYLPNLLLDGLIGEDYPENLEVTLRGEEADHPSISRPGIADPVWRYVSFEEHGSSVQYRVHAPNHTGTRDINYKLYIPKTVFEGQDYPENIWVSVGPADPSST